MNGKELIAVVSAIMLVGCQGSDHSGNSTDESMSDMATRLKSGDTSVCVDPDVQQTFAKVLVGDSIYKDFLSSGGKVPPLIAVTATSVTKDIGEVSCAGNFDFPVGSWFGKTSARVDFKVRPALDQPDSYVVETSSGGQNALLTSYLTLYRRDHNEQSQTPAGGQGSAATNDQQESSEEQPSSADINASTDDKDANATDTSDQST
jgi:hypothetical protein